MIYEEFVEFYEKYKRTPNQITYPKNRLNERQLKSQYKKFLRQEEKKKAKREKKIQDKFNEKVNFEDMKDEKWEMVKEEVYKRDGGKCQLIPKLTAGELTVFLEKSGDLRYIIDPAHIFRKGAYPQLKYDPENVILLNRYSHSMIDTYRNPVTGEPLTQTEHQKWWMRIVGAKRYMKLEEKLRSEY